MGRINGARDGPVDDALERRLFFEKLTTRFDELRDDSEAWAAVEAEREVEGGALSDGSR